jgi:nucleoside-diphosphate-sugar epimerase
MVIGSGLLANAFTPFFLESEDICIYTAGVSNSSCTDIREFAREHQRLENALIQANNVDAFVYFGTCSIADPESLNSPYVQHKLNMEALVSTHPRSLILRLPQVAGKTSNPHTLLNYLYARISRSESFDLWGNASRNIIDVDDVALIAKQIISDNSYRRIIINIANKINYPLIKIVNTFEKVIEKNAIYNILERGCDYPIGISDIYPLLEKSGVMFDDDYLVKIIIKYYK